MSWRDSLKPGSFRGVPFLIDMGVSTQIGRRTQLHEYPLRDVPWAEDLGRRGRRFSVNCLVIGSDYMTARDQLIAALEAAGPGTLVHPYYGTMRVSVVDAVDVHESTKDGGVARFRIPFAEAGDKLEPASTTDTAAQSQAQVDTTTAQLAASFANGGYSTTAVPGWVTDSATGDLGGLTGMLTRLRDSIPGIPTSITDFNAQLQAFSDSLSSLIRTPFNLGASVVSLLVGLGTIAQQPLDALGLYTQLLDFGNDATPIATTTPNRQQQATNRAALNALVQGTAVALAAAAAASVPAQTQDVVQLLPAASSSSTPSTSATPATLVATTVTLQGFDTSDAGISVRDQLTDAIDAQSLTVDDTAYPPLQDLRAALVTDIEARVSGLPSLISFVPGATLPTLVLAYRLYDDATRDAEIVARNDLPYPGFATGGQVLEVLSD